MASCVSEESSSLLQLKVKIARHIKVIAFSVFIVICFLRFLWKCFENLIVPQFW